MFKINEKFSLEDVAKILGVCKKEVQRLIREKILKSVDGNKYLICGKSLHEYIISRHQKAPKGYITIKQAGFYSGLGEYVIQCAIDRKELKTTEYRGGFIISVEDFGKWLTNVNRDGLLESDDKNCIKGGLRVKNKRGLHTRPCWRIVYLSIQYQYEKTYLFFYGKKGKISGCNLNGLLSLHAGYGDWVKYWIEGEYCDHMLIDLKNLFQHFDVYENSEIENFSCDLMAVRKDISFS